MKRGQAAGQRIARPAQLLQAGRRLVVAQAAIVAARPADDLIPASAAAGRMAVDHADRLRPPALPAQDQKSSTLAQNKRSRLLHFATQEAA